MTMIDSAKIIADAERALDWHRAENDTINDGVVEQLLDLAKRQRAALAPFAKEADDYDPVENDGEEPVWNVMSRNQLRIKHLRAARDLPPADDGGFPPSSVMPSGATATEAKLAGHDGVRTRPAGWWTEERLREEANLRGWYVREGTSVPDVRRGGYRHPFSVTVESRDLVEMLTAAEARSTDPKMVIEIKEDPTEPNRFTLIGQRHGDDRPGRSWIALVLLNGEPDLVAQRRIIEAMASGLEGRPYRDAEIRECIDARERMKAERDEADRRAGAAERELAGVEEQERRRDSWLAEAKARFGYYDPDVSFDWVWEAVLSKLGMKADEQQIARLPFPLRVQQVLPLGPWANSDGGPTVRPDPRDPFTWARFVTPEVVELAERPGTLRTPPPPGQGWFPLYREAPAGDPPPPPMRQTRKTGPKRSKA